MEPHQERVVEELRELADKQEKLKEFVERSPKFHEVPRDEQGRLIRQLRVMIEYRSILEERIAKFVD